MENNTSDDTLTAGEMTPARFEEYVHSEKFEKKYRRTLNRCAAGERMTQEEFAKAIGLSWTDFCAFAGGGLAAAGHTVVVSNQDDVPSFVLRQPKAVTH